jgi:hypothetical protein
MHRSTQRITCIKEEEQDPRGYIPERGREREIMVSSSEA